MTWTGNLSDGAFSHGWILGFIKCPQDCHFRNLFLKSTFPFLCVGPVTWWQRWLPVTPKWVSSTACDPFSLTVLINSPKRLNTWVTVNTCHYVPKAEVFWLVKLYLIPTFVIGSHDYQSTKITWNQWTAVCQIKLYWVDWRVVSA